ncbi:PilZ domain-containing protein [Acanthopleuribacter pedis]|uniref:PilZ domain-containing protein n=1 Tax=Acanthopleuribacter pedis TaxID=442870 RepID=A0A8J7QCN9_9BACT|nr:PilZ domain-containing protein [Acanthopleuribacter pedis]MBO1321334.1 PilZ domain-containing protein [Acanthopleuribacter pedis]
MLRGLFGKQKQLQGKDIELLLKMVLVDREPASVSSDSFKFVSDVLDYDATIFQVKNTLTRDEVLYQLRGKELEVFFPYELTLYRGATSLAGLGLVRNMQTLKFRVPEAMVQDEHRGAYRVSKFTDKPTVTFSTNSFDLLKAALADVSMTGAGVRLDPRWSMSGISLKRGLVVLIDLRINRDLRISTSAEIRYLSGNKMGLKFQELPKDAKEGLYRFIVKQRREEQRAMVESQKKIAAMDRPDKSVSGNGKPVVLEKPSGKPIALVAGDQGEWYESLHGALNRKFNVLHCSTSVTDVRNHLELKPNLILFEIGRQDLEGLAQLKRLSRLTPAGCVRMFYGREVAPETVDRLAEQGGEKECVVDLNRFKVLFLFKAVDNYYIRKTPH